MIKKLKSQAPNRLRLDLYLKLNNADSINAPRDLQQVTQIKHADKQSKRTGLTGDNVADDIISVMSLVGKHPFVNKISHKAGKSPTVILYTGQQLESMRKFCATTDDAINSMLSVDRTFKL